MNPYPQNQPQMYQQQPPYYTQQQPQYYQQPPQQNLVAQPSGVIPNDPSPNAGRGAASRAATKASAYGGSEVGALIGGAVGPPVIGGIVGNIVGEKMGEKAAGKTGISRAAGQMSDDLAQVVGQRNVDKMGEITMTALGYSNEEECVCCPCLPASQTLLIIMLLFFGFNCYRLGIGIDYERYCSNDLQKSTVLEKVPSEEIADNATLYSMTVISRDESTNETDLLVAYPCEFGFHYTTSGAAVWLAFLPFYITQLLGNCWRQCCCCLCDPLVCFACCLDIIKRYCCECGSFNFVSFIWHSMCAFQVVWGCFGAGWLLQTMFFREDDYQNWDPERRLIETVMASAILDITLAGSELFHKIRLHHKKRETNAQPTTSYEMS